ncbi:hypothetical protein JXA88_04635 [Candidatus Fermentibacteria bacterium]|nr:hypothetical protein [Candidatus Fermentibacteria bacterium]
MLRALSDLFAAAMTALVVSTVAFSLTAMFRPQWLTALGPVICPSGADLELRNASPVPGELVLEAWCIHGDTEREVTWRFVSTAMGVVFTPVILTVFAALSLRRRLRRRPGSSPVAWRLRLRKDLPWS